VDLLDDGLGVFAAEEKVEEFAVPVSIISR
jgi:hypothetical protein